ncbi:MAG: aminomethyl-transferring glycine dehydrogenase subunit GcvPA [Chloroflexi bacterium]|nr:aminomethyl-transferring glycine dehydrogenase subunit GcvPA [Chloroflexota bacterium]
MTGNPYSPHTPNDRAAMLAAVGVRSLDELLTAVPAAARRPAMGVPPGLSEMEVTAELERLAGLDRPAGGRPFFLGAGSYRRYIPAAVPALAARSEFLTAYTPYQPELSQGTLQAIWEYQSLVAALLAMDVANSSLYDGSTAVAEAALLAVRATGRQKVVVSRAVHPQHRAVLRTYAQGPDIEVVEVDDADLTANAAGAACLIVQSPDFFGKVARVRDVAAAAHAAGALAVASVDPIACALVEPPGECDVDIAVADGQPLGLPLSFGGPSVGLMAVRASLVRQLPGRIAGQAQDAAGRRGFVNTLQAREQHIRREKATSNICTNEAVLAIHAAVYLALLGPGGLRAVAARSVAQFRKAAAALSLPGCSWAGGGVSLWEGVLRLPRDARAVRDALLEQRIVIGHPLGGEYPERPNDLLVCCTEITTDAEIAAAAAALRKVLA